MNIAVSGPAFLGRPANDRDKARTHRAILPRLFYACSQPLALIHTRFDVVLVLDETLIVQYIASPMQDFLALASCIRVRIEPIVARRSRTSLTVIHLPGLSHPDDRRGRPGGRR